MSTTGVHLITHAIRPCHRLGHENSINWFGRWPAVDRRQSTQWSGIRWWYCSTRNVRDKMQQLTETVETEGKKMNVKKCKTLVSDSWEDSREIRIRGTEVENVEDFCYLGSWLSTNGNCDKDCQIRIGKASNVFGRLQDVWRNKHISLKVKVRL